MDANADVQVHPHAVPDIHDLAPMAGRIVRDGHDSCFVPRFAFVEGTTYAVVIDGMPPLLLLRPLAKRSATCEVLAVHPEAPEVPRNLLRFYIRFSAPMSEGHAFEHVRLLDDEGNTIVGALLLSEHELWDSARRQLTVLLDPARIKRGLIAHKETGYPLKLGAHFRLVVDDGFRDAQGVKIRNKAERRYAVGSEENRRVDPDRFVLTVPSKGTDDPLCVAFERPLDHRLLIRCVHVVGPHGVLVEGAQRVGPEARSWWFAPRQPWVPGPHSLVIDPILEDLAGNSVRRVFDRDLGRPEDGPIQDVPVKLTFRPS